MKSCSSFLRKYRRKKRRRSSTEFKRIAEETGATLKNEEAWGRRRLAYPIHKFNEGIYHLFVFESEAALAELDRRMKNSDRDPAPHDRAHGPRPQARRQARQAQSEEGARPPGSRLRRPQRLPHRPRSPMHAAAVRRAPTKRAAGE